MIWEMFGDVDRYHCVWLFSPCRVILSLRPDTVYIGGHLRRNHAFKEVA